MGRDAPLGVFEEQVLLAILRTGEEAYGMTIRRAIETLTDRDITIGAVYATLDRLEAKRLVTSRRTGSGAGSRRHFALTREGTRMLAVTRAMRDRLWRGVRLEWRPSGS